MRAKSQREATDLEIVKYEKAALKGSPERRQIRRELGRQTQANSQKRITRTKFLLRTPILGL